MAITRLQQGKYIEATEKLESTRDVLDSRRQMFPNLELRKQSEGELEWWLALSLLRQGRYREAKEKLDKLMVELTQKARGLDAQTTEEQHVLNLARVGRILAFSQWIFG